MEPVTTIILLLVAAVLLLAVEALLPTHGVLGVAGAIAACGAIVLAFLLNRWIGLGLLVVAVAMTPFIFSGMLKLWERSPIGRRVLLTAVTPALEHERIQVGDVGRTISELRPMGEAEFGPVSVQVTSRRGTVPSGVKVRVIAYEDGLATVEPIELSEGSLS